MHDKPSEQSVLLFEEEHRSIRSKIKPEISTSFHVLSSNTNVTEYGAEDVALLIDIFANRELSTAHTDRGAFALLLFE